MPKVQMPLQPEPGEFETLARDYNYITVYTEWIADVETPVSAFAKISSGGPCYLLESAEKNDTFGRFSFIGFDPARILQARGRSVRITDADGKSQEIEAEPDALQALKGLMKDFRPAPTEALFSPFTGGAVGYLAYDMVRFFEPSLPEPAPDDLGLPDMFFLIGGTLLVFDHRYRRLWITTGARVESPEEAPQAYQEAAARIRAAAELLAKPVQLPPINVLDDPEPLEPRSNTRREEYLEMVEKAKEYIRAGDIFQVVPSQRFEVDYEGRPIDLYRALRFINPSPYMFCLHMPDGTALVGSSPEVHVRVQDQRIDIRPIAGTRRRGGTPEEDEANAQDLLNDPKERAEHIMLVDLARNDVGRIAHFHSVEVTDLMIIEKYSHVMHIVSNVIGKLREDRDAYDVMRATFPAGTVSGSPKVRAMQIIAELEKNKRCSYAGAVGYFGFDGNHDSCIALRTVVLKNGKAYVQAGGGVVADSTPEGEYQETVNKAMGMMRAIERAAHLHLQQS